MGAIDQSGSARHDRTTRGAGRLLVCAAAALIGVALYLVGLPAGASLFGTALSDLTLPAALFVGFAGVTLAGARAAGGTRWRVVDIVVASVLGVAGGLLFGAWNAGVWPALNGALAFYPPASSILVGVWLLPAVLGGLVIRKPGAAVYTELVAAVLSAFIGNQWGFATVWYGLVEGLGAEVVFAVLLYRSFGLPAALLAGAGAGITVGLMDALLYFPLFSAGYRSAYVLGAIGSGVLVAGLGGWALTRALAGSGALAPLASGRVADRV
jgi:energy-coupling factor transport system substrate-specific component